MCTHPSTHSVYQAPTGRTRYQGNDEDAHTWDSPDIGHTDTSVALLPAGGLSSLCFLPPVEDLAYKSSSTHSPVPLERGICKTNVNCPGSKTS